MHVIKLSLVLLTLCLFALNLGCDDGSDGNAIAQPAPTSKTGVTGKVNTPSEQTCPTLIEGISANDTIYIEINSTGNMTGDAYITDATAGTSAECSGNTEDSLPPAHVTLCRVSGSTIPGISVDDIMEIEIEFSMQFKDVGIASPSGCAYITIETINANN